MKKILLITYLLLFGTISNAQNTKLMTFQGEITNNKFDFISIAYGRDRGKKIMISKEGFFFKTIYTTPKVYNMYYGNSHFHIFLKNGYELTLKMNSDSWESLVFSGKGAAENNFLTHNPYFPNPIYFNSLLSLNKSDFLKEIKKFKSNLLEKLKTENLDPDFNKVYKDYLEYFYEKSKKAYKK